MDFIPQNIFHLVTMLVFHEAHRICLVGVQKQTKQSVLGAHITTLL